MDHDQVYNDQYAGQIYFCMKFKLSYVHILSMINLIGLQKNSSFFQIALQRGKIKAGKIDQRIRLSKLMNDNVCKNENVLSLFFSPCSITCVHSLSVFTSLLATRHIYLSQCAADRRDVHRCLFASNRLRKAKTYICNLDDQEET